MARSSMSSSSRSSSRSRSSSASTGGPPARRRRRDDLPHQPPGSRAARPGRALLLDLQRHPRDVDARVGRRRSGDREAAPVGRGPLGHHSLPAGAGARGEPVSIFDMTVPWYEILLRTFVVYLTVLVLLRAAGKRELGQMTPFDLVVILVIANAVQNAMTGGDNSLIGGILAAGTLTLVNVAVGRWGRRVPPVRRPLASQPPPPPPAGKTIKPAP